MKKVKKDDDFAFEYLLDALNDSYKYENEIADHLKEIERLKELKNDHDQTLRIKAANFFDESQIGRICNESAEKLKLHDLNEKKLNDLFADSSSIPLDVIDLLIKRIELIKSNESSNEIKPPTKKINDFWLNLANLLLDGGKKDG